MKHLAIILLFASLLPAQNKRGIAANMNTYGAGSTAVSRSVQDKLNDSVSVKDYGATGDGTTDDSAAFAAALAASDHVRVPHGTYRLNSVLSLTSQKVLECEGTPTRWPSTSPSILDARGGVKIDAPTVDIVSVSIIGCAIDGTNASSTTHGVFLEAGYASRAIAGVLLERVAITNFPDYQFYSRGNTFDITLRRVTIHNQSRSGSGTLIRMNDEDTANAIDFASQITFDDCWFFQYGGSAAKAVVVGSSSNIRWINGTMGGVSGSNGADLCCGLDLMGTHIEGNAAAAGTFGIRYTGANGAIVMPSALGGYDDGIQIGDPTSKAESVSKVFVTGSVAGDSCGVRMVDGGARQGVVLGPISGTICNDRVTVDAADNEVIRLAMYETEGPTWLNNAWSLVRRNSDGSFAAGPITADSIEVDDLTVNGTVTGDICPDCVKGAGALDTTTRVPYVSASGTLDDTTIEWTADTGLNVSTTSHQYNDFSSASTAAQMMLRWRTDGTTRAFIDYEGSANYLRVDPAGYLAINGNTHIGGITEPDSTLQVTGDITASGTVYGANADFAPAGGTTNYTKARLLDVVDQAGGTGYVRLAADGTETDQGLYVKDSSGNTKLWLNIKETAVVNRAEWSMHQIPSANDTYTLGESGGAWGDVWAGYYNGSEGANFNGRVDVDVPGTTGGSGMAIFQESAASNNSISMAVGRQDVAQRSLDIGFRWTGLGSTSYGYLALNGDDATTNGLTIKTSGGFFHGTADGNESPLTFNSPLSRSTNTVSCPTCMVQASDGFTVDTTSHQYWIMESDSATAQMQLKWRRNAVDEGFLQFGDYLRIDPNDYLGVNGNVHIGGVTDPSTALKVTGNATVTGTLTATVSGNASTATALAANGSNCSSGYGAGGVSAAGAAEDCTQYLQPSTTIAVTAVNLNPSGARPTCDSSVRGVIWHEEGGAGVKDTVAVCAKDAGDAYAWRTIY